MALLYFAKNRSYFFFFQMKVGNIGIIRNTYFSYSMSVYTFRLTGDFARKTNLSVNQAGARDRLMFPSVYLTISSMLSTVNVSLLTFAVMTRAIGSLHYTRCTGGTVSVSMSVSLSIAGLGTSRLVKQHYQESNSQHCEHDAATG